MSLQAPGNETILRPSSSFTFCFSTQPDLYRVPNTMFLVFSLLLCLTTTTFFLTPIKKKLKIIPQAKTPHKSHKQPFSIDRPSLLSGKILHIRHFPIVHAFRYSFPMIGVPITYQEVTSSWISVESSASSKNGWLQVNAADHLGRDENKNGGLRGKLDRYLESQVRSSRSFPFLSRGTSSRKLEVVESFVLRMG